MDQQQRRVETCNNKLLENPAVVVSGWRGRIVTGDEMCWIFYRKATNRENVWIKLAAQPAVQFTKQDCFAQNVVMLCVWWNFEGIINHFGLVQNGAVNSTTLYSEQLDHVMLPSRLVIQP